MPRPFTQTFNWLYSKLPFSDTARTILRVWAEAIRRELLDFQTEADEVYDAIYIPGGDTTDLDNWGDVLDFARCPTEPDDNWGIDCPGAVGDYILVNFDPSLDFQLQVTVDLRFRLDVVAGVQVLYSRANLQQEITVTAAGALQWDVMPGTVVLSAPGVIVPATLYHVRAMYDSVLGAELWLGQPGGTFALLGVAGAAGAMAPAAWPLTIGNGWGLVNPIDGIVDEPRAVEDFILTAPTDEVPRCLEIVTNTRLMLHCDEAAGPIAADTSGNGNDGTLQGLAAWFDMTTTWWSGFRTRILTEWQTTFSALTVTAVTNAVDALGATYVPVLAVDDVAEHYIDRLETGTGAANNYDLGDRWGISRLDLSTFAVEIDRIPTLAEATEMIEAIGLVRPAQTKGFLVCDLPAPPGTPPRYRLYGTSYSDIVAPWLWDDNFESPLPPLSIPAKYQIINDLGGPPLISWQYAIDGGNDVLWGDASQGAAALPCLCLPRLDLDPELLEYRDMYIDCSLRVTNVVVDDAGICLRYDDATDDFYYLAFRWTGAVWQYAFFYWDGAAMNVILAWAPTVIAMDVYRHVQVWLENDEFTFILDGTVMENKTDIKRVGVLDIAVDGEWGFCTYGAGVATRDIYIDWWRMW